MFCACTCFHKLRTHVYTAHGRTARVCSCVHGVIVRSSRRRWHVDVGQSAQRGLARRSHLRPDCILQARNVVLRIQSLSFTQNQSGSCCSSWFAYPQYLSCLVWAISLMPCNSHRLRDPRRRAGWALNTTLLLGTPVRAHPRLSVPQSTKHAR